MLELVYKSMRNPTVNVCKGESIAKIRFNFFFVKIYIYTYICDHTWEKGPCRTNSDFSV